MSHSIRDEMRYYAIFQPSAYSQGVKSYRPHTRTRLRESRQAYGPGPANGYGVIGLYYAAQAANQQSIKSQAQEAATVAQSEFRSGKTYPSAQSMIAASAQWGQPISTTPTSVESAQYKVATVMYMIGMLQGLSSSARVTIGQVADAVYDDANSWFSVDSRNTESVSNELIKLRPSVSGVAATAASNGASSSDATALANYVGAIQEYTTASTVQHRQDLEEDRTLTGQGKDIAGERMKDITEWSCFVSRLIGVNESVCPEETTPQKFGRYAVYAGGIFLAGGLFLYAGRPYVEALQALFAGDE